MQGELFNRKPKFLKTLLSGEKKYMSKQMQMQPGL